MSIDDPKELLRMVFDSSPRELLTPLKIVRELLPTMAATLRDHQRYQLTREGALIESVRSAVLYRLHPIFKTPDIVEWTLEEVIRDWHELAASSENIFAGSHCRVYAEEGEIFIQALERPPVPPRAPYQKAQALDLRSIKSMGGDLNGD